MRADGATLFARMNEGQYFDLRAVYVVEGVGRVRSRTLSGQAC